jgi:hypothetical protein
VTGFAARKDAFTTEKDLVLQSIGGLGFRPAAVVAWWARVSQSATRSGNCGGIGFCTQRESAAVAWISVDGTASTTTARLADNAALLGLSEAGTEVALRAHLESFDEDGMTLRYTTGPEDDWVVHFVAFGGSIQDQRVGWMSPSSTVVSQKTGFWPANSGVVLLGAAPLELGVVSPSLAVVIGAADTRSAAVAGYVCPNGSPPGEVTGMQRRGATPFAWPTLGGPSRLCYLSLDGLRAKVGTDVSPRGPGRRHTRVGFRPSALIFFSWGLSSSPAVASIGRLCIGGWTSDRTGCISWDDRNVEADETRTHARSSLQEPLLVTDTRTGGIHAQARVTSVDDHGFTLDWTNDGGEREFAYVALGRPTTRGRASRALERISRLPRT